MSPRLYVAVNGAGSEGVLHDVSDDGLALDVVGPSLTDERVLLDFEMSETGEHFEGIGKIVWKNASETRVGLQFIDLPDTSRHKVRDWLEARKSSPELAQNILVQDRGESDLAETSVAPPPAPSRPEPSTKAASGVSAPSSSEATVSVPSVSTSKTLARPGSLTQPKKNTPIMSEAQTGSTTLTETYSRSARRLRSAISKHFGAKSILRTLPSWRDIPMWMLLFAVVIVATAVLVMAMRMRGRPTLPHTSTKLEVLFEKTPPDETANIAAAGPKLPASVVKLLSAPLSDANSGKMGRVTQKTSGEIPVTEVIPDYPTFALLTDLQGRVTLNAVIGADGNVRDVRIDGPSSMLDSAALAAVKKWQYAPHYENGKPVEAEAQIIVDFSIAAK